MTTQTIVSTNSTNRAQLLRRTLYANGAFSLFSGLLFTFAASSVASFMGIADFMLLGLLNGTTFILIMGIAVVLFAPLLFWIASQTPLNRTFARTIFVMDVAWVVISALLLLPGVLPLTTGGFWGILIVADIVLVFAVLEHIGIRRLRS
jgi:hypothetical protein